ncbi:MAG: FKBP-type peptidyl-prolyl cis-trans isomerase [Rikenellaceae bacterium]
MDSASYAVGVSLGSMVKQANFGDLNLKEVNKAIADVIGDKTLKIDLNKANEVIQGFVVKRQAAVAAENKEKGGAFLKENGTKDSVVTTASGLQYKIIKEGTGIKPVAEDTVQVNYKGTLIDGKEFDSSYTRGEPVSFPLNGVIKGWTEGLQLVGEGGKIRLFIPAELGYGEQQAGPTIGPNSTLIFDVELLKVKKSTATPEVAAKVTSVAPVKK